MESASLRLRGYVLFPDGRRKNLRDRPEPVVLGGGARLSGKRLWNFPDEDCLRADHFSMELVEEQGELFVCVAAVDGRRQRQGSTLPPLPSLWLRRRGTTLSEPLHVGDANMHATETSCS